MAFTYDQFDLRNYKPNVYEASLFRGHNINTIISQFNDNDEFNYWLCTDKFQVMLFISYIIGNKPEIIYISPQYNVLYTCVAYLRNEILSNKYKEPCCVLYRTKLNDTQLNKSHFDTCKSWRKFSDFDHDLLEHIIKSILGIFN